MNTRLFLIPTTHLLHKNLKHLVAACFVFLLSFISHAQTQTAVQKYGALHVSGTKIVDKNNSPVILRGMSLYWSQWQPRYYNYNTIKWLRDDWKVTVVRAAMGVDYGGYATNPTTEQNKIYTVIDACISLGIYVIVDFHVDVNNFTSNAKTFFNDVSKKYGNIPNILYEPWNEPINDSWANVIKPYHESIIDIIRKNAPGAIVICGTGFYSQNVDEASANPVNRTNVAYTLHFYANTHKQALRDKAQVAINNGKAIFVTEYGTTDASGDGYVNQAETNTWWSFLDANGIGYCNWSLSDVSESSAALINSSVGLDNWSTSQLKESGNFVRNMLRAKVPDLSTGTSSIANGTYKITFRHSGLSLNVEGASTANGGNVVQWGYNNGNNEKWYVKNAGNNQYSVINVNSGKGLDVNGNSTADGADVNQWTYSGNNNQKWLIQSVGSGYYKIVSVSSNKCIDMYNSSTTAGNSIEQWTCNGGNNQSFTFTQLSTTTNAMSNTVANKVVQPENNMVSVYPNPSSKVFTINKTDSYSYVISNAAGAVVEKGKANGKISVGEKLMPGAYTLSLLSGGEVKTFKLLKN